MKSKNKFFIILAVFGIIALFIYAYFKEGSLPVDRSDTTNHIFVINSGENFNTIVKNLENDNLIRSRVVFYLIVKQLQLERKIQAGNFRLSPSMDAYKIAEALTHGTSDTWITIIEGLRKEEIAELVAKKFDISEVEFNKLAPEGYLYPDTYLLPEQATADTIITTLRNTFESKYTQDLRNKARLIPLSDEQVVILASLVEREARTEEDRRTVASIMLKRLKNDWPLDLDATIQYAIGYQPAEKRWWKQELSVDDLKLDSPYNTYRNKGLPPGPICSPSLSSIKAVVEANPSTPYWYYLAEPGTGVTHFAKTNDEHEANIRKYLR